MEVEQHVQRYTKYIHEDLSSVDIDTATYKDHLHKIFEWLWCIFLTKEHHSIFLRWEDIPPDEREKKGMMRDMGIDAWDMKGNRVIQMKCYNGLISWRCISTFLACCSLQFKDAVKMLCRTLESSLHPLIQGGITNGDILDKTISDHVFRTECKRIQSLSFPAVTSTEKLTIRPYQEQAIYFMEKGQETTKNVYLSIPTGCGKTFIILQYHQRNIAEKMLVLVPTIVLLEQWGTECKKMGIRSFLIGTGHHHSLNELTEETIVICVYNSIVNIHTELPFFERYVVDEAHHVKTPERYMDNEVEFNDSDDEFEEEFGKDDEKEFEDDDEYDEDEEEFEEEFEEEKEEKEDIKDEKKEKPYSSYIRALADTKKVVYISATLDKPEDDSIFYEYSVRQAITDGHLVDYQFVFPIYEQDDVTNDQLAYYLVHIQHETHCIVYASSCEEGKKFQEQLNRLRPGCAGYIDANTSSSERKRLFEAFEAGLILFLINVRVLVEGFNATHCRSIFFLHVSSNEVFVIQAIGRALRLHPDKTLATIYVPYTSENDLDRIQSFLAHLSTYDERIKASMDTKSIGGYIRLEKMEKMEEMEDDDEDEKKEETLCGHRYNLVVDSMGKSDKFEELWKSKLEEVKKFINEHGKRPSHREQSYIKHLGIWVNNQVKNFKFKIKLMKYETVRKLWEEFINDQQYHKYFLTNEEEWNNNLEKCMKYINIHNKRPSNSDKDKNIKKLGWWIGTQIKNYKNQTCIMLNEIIKNKWEEFIMDEKYIKYFLNNEEAWNYNFEKCKEYIDRYEKLPSEYLGRWIGTQTKTYKTKTCIMTDEKIAKKWEEFITNSKYIKYFLTNEEEWNYNLEKCKDYIDTHKKRPSSEDKDKNVKYLGTWILHQLKNYINKSQIMKVQTISNKWEEFVNNEEYHNFFLSNEEEWNYNLEMCKKYINEHNKRPQVRDKDKHIKYLGAWLVGQMSSYKTHTYILKNELIRKKWEEFIKDEKYKLYFITNEDIWVYNLDKCKIFINTYKKRPSIITDKTLANWLSDQQKNYKKHNNIMKDELIRKKWEEFITDEMYQHYF
jgi:superfamily II DNA or RNA helicase